MSAMAAEDLVAEGLMGMPEAEAFSGLSRSTLYVMMGRGELAYVVLGRRRLIPRKALVQLAASGLRGGGDGAE